MPKAPKPSHCLPVDSKVTIHGPAGYEFGIVTKVADDGTIHIQLCKTHYKKFEPYGMSEITCDFSQVLQGCTYTFGWLRGVRLHGCRKRNIRVYEFNTTITYREHTRPV